MNGHKPSSDCCCWLSPLTAGPVSGAPSEVVQPSDSRASLLESIRNAGGIGKAKLRNVKERKMEKKKQKEQEQGARLFAWGCGSAHVLLFFNCYTVQLEQWWGNACYKATCDHCLVSINLWVHKMCHTALCQAVAVCVYMFDDLCLPFWPNLIVEHRLNCWPNMRLCIVVTLLERPAFHF